MRILISSYLFYPSVGGIEEVSHLLTHEFIKQGHEVKLITWTRLKKGQERKETPFEVVRRPGFWRLLWLVGWCDVYFQNNISLKLAWPLLLIWRPWVVAHHIWLSRSSGRLGWQDYFKRFFIRGAKNITASEALSHALPVSSVVIPDPYDDETFQQLSGEGVEKLPLLFVGRLVSDKGCDLLLQALEKLKKRGLTPLLTVAGVGPEGHCLRRLIYEFGIGGQVRFLGEVNREELAALFRSHKILVMSSRWNEPFGIVALEAVACGCVVIGSQGGGLKESIGPCGVTFPNGDVSKLIEAIQDLLTHPEKLEIYKTHAEFHLQKHKAAVIAKEYLRVFEEAMK